jgi:glycosyltransferase involved in cell wall biosynthesis
MADVLFVMVRGPVGEVYGGEKSTMTTAEALAPLGHRTRFLVTAHDDLERELAERGLACEVVAVHNPFDGFRAAGWRDRARRLAAIARLNLQAYRHGRRSRDAVLHAAQLTGFYSAWLGARLAGAKIVLHMRGTNGRARTRLLEEAAVLLSDRTVCVSRSLRQEIVAGSRRLGRLLAPRLEAIYNGFDFAEMDAFAAAHARAACRAALGVAPDETLALLVGGIDYHKGQLRFLERVLPAAAAAVPGLRLAIVGGAEDAACVAACREAVRRAGLEARVRFTGYLPKAEVYRHYRAADVLVLPSQREGLPRCAIEGAGFGLPVLGTSIVGTVEAVRDGETGYLVPWERLEEIAPHLVRLARDRELAARLGRAGAAHVRAEFAADRNAQEISRVYREILSPPATPRT